MPAMRSLSEHPGQLPGVPQLLALPTRAAVAKAGAKSSKAGQPSHSPAAEADHEVTGASLLQPSYWVLRQGSGPVWSELALQGCLLSAHTATLPCREGA